MRMTSMGVIPQGMRMTMRVRMPSLIEINNEYKLFEMNSHDGDDRPLQTFQIN